MAQPTSLLDALCTALGRKYQTRYTWRPLLDVPCWGFVPDEAGKPLWTVVMQDLIRTHCVNLDTLISLVHPYHLPIEAPVRLQCRQCQATGLEHFYTSKRDQTTLCAACFAERETRQLAKEEIALSSPSA